MNLLYPPSFLPPSFSEVGLHIWDTLNGAAWFSSVLARLRHWGGEGGGGQVCTVSSDATLSKPPPQGQIKPCVVATEMRRRAGRRTTSSTSLSQKCALGGGGVDAPTLSLNTDYHLENTRAVDLTSSGTPPPSVPPVPSGLQVLASVHSSQPSEDRNTSPWRQPWTSGASFEAKAPPPPRYWNCTAGFDSVLKAFMT